MRHLDLFSGIGGFALAAREVWGSEYENIGFCEIDHFCQQVLTKNFPKAKIYSDIRAVTNTTIERDGKMAMERQPNQKNIDANGRVDLITGGFPCQPFSQAGQRRGAADDRYLWPEMLRLIREVQPTWVIAENVGGLVTWNDGMVFGTVCADLEAAGYEVQSFIIPAAAVAAPHRRDRIWFIAKDSLGKRRRRGRDGDTAGSERQVQNARSGHARPENAANPRDPRLQRHEQPGTLDEEARPPRPATECHWNENWLKVAARLCRVDDGLPKRVVRLPDGTTITEAKWRQEAIKAYGNAIVPQVAMQIMKAIKEAW